MRQSSKLYNKRHNVKVNFFCKFLLHCQSMTENTKKFWESCSLAVSIDEPTLKLTIAFCIQNAVITQPTQSEGGYEEFVPAFGPMNKKEAIKRENLNWDNKLYSVLQQKYWRFPSKLIEFEFLLHWINWKLSAVCCLNMTTLIETLMIEIPVRTKNLFMGYDVIAKTQ